MSSSVRRMNRLFTSAQRSVFHNIQTRYYATKVFDDVREAIKPVQSGNKLIVGGFGLCGTPQKLIEAIRDSGAKDLTVVSNNCGVDDWGLGLLLQTKQVCGRFVIMTDMKR
jgi:acyl CoA:acetate/3-ketoacid CoA transferase alpha subunit